MPRHTTRPNTRPATRRTTRALALAAGAALAITALPAAAQSGGQSDADRDRPQTRPVQTQVQTQDRTRDQARRGATDHALAADVIRKLEGVWHVRIEMAPQLSRETDRARPLTGDRTPQRPDRDRPDRNTTDQDRPNDRLNDPRDPNRSNPDRDAARPGQSDTTAAAPTTMVTREGFARSDVLFDGAVLRQSFVVDRDAPAGAPITRERNADPARTDRDVLTDPRDNADRPAPGQPTRARTADDKMRGLSLLAFNQQDSTYSAVFLTSDRPGMHYDTGRFDESSSRIEFDGRDTAAHRRSPGANANDMDNVRVVLEMPSPDRHVVTMYRRDAAAAAPSNGARASDRTGEVLYRATYTRLSGAEAIAAQRVLDLDENASRTYTRHPGSDD